MTQRNIFLEQLDPALRKRYEPHLRTMRVPKGWMIVAHGAVSNEVYFVVEGELRVLLYSPGGKEVSISALGPGDIFGEMAAIDGASRAATVTAATPAVLQVMPHQSFRECLETSPAAALWIARHFSKQIRALNNRLFELVTLNVSNRLHFELLRLARLTSKDSNHAVIQPAPTHGELASRIGTHREAVTREMGDLARRGIVHQDGRVLEIVKLDELSRVVQNLSGQAAGVYMAPHGPDNEWLLHSAPAAKDR